MTLPKLNYRKASAELKTAWFAYLVSKGEAPTTVSITNFAAGYNAALAWLARPKQEGKP